ncbi:hypothetical protein CFIO01_00435 [Colletotrichum fioriniae PJ7]|uniref:Uncharacterized protein n=1 Tax=Colletotrichum fioriniae PJ7 TaxID=1445577 RepID=A0A010QGW3_9PEZI|nr:hypothetical protein CFIO01_00435 [Colletotrichum fioriniae PJ7]
MLDIFPDLYPHSYQSRINIYKAKSRDRKRNFTLTTSNAMASRYPMPNTYTKSTRQKTDSSSSSSLSAAVKSIFSAPTSYPSTPYSTSKYPLPTAYTPRDETNNKGSTREQQMSMSSRVSVESRNTIDEIKEEQLRGLGR